MLPVLLLAASAISSSSQEPSKEQLHSAIWADLQLNAMIGNGNWPASLWYQAGSDTAPDLHIRDLTCTKEGSQPRCSFNLHRDGGPKTVLGEAAAADLACSASFFADGEGWSVVHTPPRHAGHSVTSMRCKAV
ncbi:hypothetical protein [Sphingomonas sp.]|uniref:hypothetical protein n=1 Tax=Sphingomonas sp. TaxID=28214 RepID=UPI002FD9CE09